MFVKGSENKLGVLGIGKKQLIEDWLKEYHFKKYELRPDFSIDVIGHVNLYLREDKLPEFIQFNRIFGSFVCSNGKLTTLKGFPYEIDSYFGCHNNKLSSFDFFPKCIGSNCFIHKNPIVDPLKETEIRDYLRSKSKIKGQIDVISRDYISLKNNGQNLYNSI